MPAQDAISGATALCGLGMTELGRVYERSAADLASLAEVGSAAAISGKALLEEAIKPSELKPFLPNA